MRKYLLVALAAGLTGCAVPPQGPGYANSGYAQPRDPSQWRVVSVTPVPPGTAARIAAKSGDGKAVEYTSSPVPQHIYNTTPVYDTAPVYGYPAYPPQPSYHWPPVNLSLGYVFGRHWSRGYGGAHFRGRRR